jgi:hypothetical protein
VAPADASQSIDYDGTISYTNQPGSGAGFYDCASATSSVERSSEPRCAVYLDPNTVAFSIMSGKKCDRGTFTVGQVMHECAIASGNSLTPI